MEEHVNHSRARAKLEAICVRVAGRTHVNHACALEGVPRSSLYALIDADEDARLMLDAARAEAAESRRKEIELLALGIPNEGMSSPNANVLLHLLERSHPDEYAPPKTRTEVTGAEGKPQEHAVTVTITREQALSLARKKGTP